MPPRSCSPESAGVVEPRFSLNLLSEAELIDLENWAIKLKKRFDKATQDEEFCDVDAWNKKYPELPYYAADRDRLYGNLRTVIDLARTVKNLQK